MSFRCGDCENFNEEKSICILLPNEEIESLTQANFYCDGEFDFGMEE